MSGTDLSVLVVDDDFRVANLHAEIVAAIPAFTVVATANTVAAARGYIGEGAFDLALVDVYLPDGSGIDLVRDITFDAMMLTAATEADTIRAALSAGALSYLVKPFPHAALAARLGGYARYRRILARPDLGAADVDAALECLRPAMSAASAPSVPIASPTKDLVLHAIQSSRAPMSAGEVSVAIGISRATAQRYLAALVAKGTVVMRLRYGSTGRPEQEYSAGSR